ncbi:MAG: FxsA family protein [Pseudomonadota bacterium]
MRFGLVLLFIAVPLVELALLIRLGNWLGLWPTLGIIVATAIAGTALLRQQGIGTLNRALASLNQGEAPVGPMVEGILLLIAGAFLLTPGILTDFVGGLILIPPIRQWLAAKSLGTVFKRVDINIGRGRGGPGRPGGHDTNPSEGPAGPMSGGRSGGPVIDGEYERVGEKTVDPRRGSSDE